MSFFLAPKIRISARKSVFSYGTPFFGKVALVTLGVGSVLAPSDLVSYSSAMLAFHSVRGFLYRGVQLLGSDGYKPSSDPLSDPAAT